jgi:hypothetical protein
MPVKVFRPAFLVLSTVSVHSFSFSGWKARLFLLCGLNLHQVQKPQSGKKEEEQ